MHDYGNGGPAFPLPAVMPSTSGPGAGGQSVTVFYQPAQPGMSLRDYFAASALQSMVADNYRRGSEFGYTPPETLAAEAYKQAYALQMLRRYRRGELNAA